MRAPLVLLCALLAAVPARADVLLSGMVAATARRFEEARKKEDLARARPSESAWADAVADLRAILHREGDDLVQLDRGPAIQARLLVHARLARFPSQGLEVYRKRVEPLAQRWLEDGIRDGNEALLLRVIEDFFCSKSAARALERLGDLAFERGDFDQAQRYWRMLLPAEKDAHPLDLHHPDPGDPPAIQARILLARRFQGEVADWKAEVAHFRARYPRAEGWLAGSKGNLADRLAEAGADPGPALTESGWPTFAGSPTRQRRLANFSPEWVARVCREGEMIRFRLDEHAIRSEKPDEKVLTAAQAARRLSCFPIVAGRKLIFADPRHVVACDLDTGKREIWYDAGFPATISTPAPADLRCTLTLADQASPPCVLARLGTEALKPGDGKLSKEFSVLVCLNLEPDARGQRVRWRALLERGEKGPTHFEGAPVVVGNDVLIAVTRFDGNQATTAVHCYPLDSRGLATPRWKRDVCITRDLKPEEGRHRHQLLTVAGRQIVYCSHTGAVVALDAHTGKRIWGLHYPSREEPERPGTLRDLNPCIYHDGKVYVAPNDSLRIYCLDAATGRVLWERARIRVVSLLGIGKGRLIFTTTTPRPGLRAIDADSGADLGGWFRSGEGAPIHPHGRGVLTGDLVYWPTLHHVYVLRQEDGDAPADGSLLHRLPPGNLLLHEKVIAVAGAEELTLFLPPARLTPSESSTARPGQGTPRRPASALDSFLAQFSPARWRGRGEELLLPLERAWEAEGSGERFLAPAGEVREVVSVHAGQDGPEVICREVSTGTIRWKSTINRWPSWLSAEGDRLIVAGPTGITCLGRADGILRWEHPGANLSEFHLRGGRFFFVEGRRRLCALSLETGLLLWSRQAPSAFACVPDRAGDFHSPYRLLDRAVVVPDLGVVLDPATGADRELLSEEESRVVCRDASGRAVWSHPLAGKTTLTGSPPQVLPGPEGSLLVIVERNHGDTVELFRRSGPAWEYPPLFFSGGVKAEGISVDDRAFYLVHENQLQAWSLSDGKRLWSRPLPEKARHWRTVALGQAVLAWPAGETFSPRPMGPVALEWGTGGNRLGDFSAVVVDRRTGRLVQRLNVPGEEPAARAWPMLPWLTRDAAPILARIPEGLVFLRGRQAVVWRETVSREKSASRER